MPSVKLKNYLHLHFIVFIWGFTAVLGKLITIDALPLVWYRMLLAMVLIFIFIRAMKFRLRVPGKNLRAMVMAGIVIALHWYTFFEAIKISTVSIALAAMATGALFAAILEPIWYKRKLIWYEIAFGLTVMGGLFIIFKVETAYTLGIALALISAFLAAVFSLINGKLIREERPSVISFYEMATGFVFISLLIGVQGGYTPEFFMLSAGDWLFIGILASICTAYAFIAAVRVMRHITPYTVMLTTNLEPVYGIVLAYLFLGDTEKMNPLFYVGAGIILTTVLGNGILKNWSTVKKPIND